MNGRAKIYEVAKWFAKKHKTPMAFVAVPLAQTDKGIYLYGHGSSEVAKIGSCMQCGRALTHPVSVELGIGPECGGHYWDWNAVGGYNKKNINHLKQKISEIKIDGWYPKSIIEEIDLSEEKIEVPKDHHIINGNGVTKKKENKKTAVLVNNRIKITFPFDREILEIVKSIPGRKFHMEERPKFWSCPISQDAVDILEKADFKIDEKIKESLTPKTPVQEIDEIEIPGLNGDLYPFQKKGVAFIESRGGKTLIADQMGLGKTIQALAWLQLHPKKRPAVIIVPASVKYNWENEALAWMEDPKVQVLEGTKPYPITGEIIIINYDILSDWVTEIQKISPKVMVLDEIHYTKNGKAKRTRAVKKLFKNVNHIIGLSGTPIVNRPVEAFNALSMIAPTVFPNRWHFLHTYCDAKHNGFGWDFNGSSNEEELHKKLIQSVMIRREKEHVLTDLPDKIRSFVPIQLENKKEYLQAERNFVNWLKETKGEDAAKKAKQAEHLVKIEHLKQVAADGKLKQSINWIRDYIESGNKLVVFATHKKIINALMNEFKGIAVKLDGSTAPNKRTEIIKSFQEDESVKLFVGNIKAAGIGITLTAASSVAFLELPWTPGDIIQAEDRCHRIGQKNAVNVYYLLAKNTIDEKIAKILDKKRKVLDAILDGKKEEEISTLTSLIKSYEED